MGNAGKWEHVLRLPQGTLVPAQVSEVTRSLLQEVLKKVPGGGWKLKDLPGKGARR